jgi:putative FmdB family regulatory protein
MSKLMMFDFECQDGHRFEELVSSKVRKITCPTCGDPAYRQISAPRIDYTGMAMTDGMETAADRFAKSHEQRRAIEERNYKNHGDYGKPSGSD